AADRLLPDGRMRGMAMRVSLIALAGALALGGCEAASEGEAAGVGAQGPGDAEVAEAGDAHPPLGRYVCRQYMTTIGWIDLTEDGYSVNDVAGTYDYDPGSGAIEWQGGAY